MSNKKTLLSLAVAAGLGAVSLQASAAGPTVYGDLSYALSYTGASTDGGNSSYALGDNVSLVGVKGEAAKIGNTSYYYDLNMIYLTSTPGVHLAVVGMKGDMGDLSVGTRVNGLFSGMVDGGTYLTNFYYTPGMSALQVSNGITYKTTESGGFQLGVQAFDIAKDGGTGNNTTNYTAAGTYAMGSLTFGLGYTKYSDYSPATDTDMSGQPTDNYDGVAIKSSTGISAAYKADKFGVVAAYDMRKPKDSASNTSTINTAMVTGSYSVSDKTTFVANFSNTSQSSGVKGTILTAMVSYAPTAALLYTFEIQTSDKDANATGLSYSTGAGGTKSNVGFAAGVIYNF
jgi:predicted porin